MLIVLYTLGFFFLKTKCCCCILANVYFAPEGTDLLNFIDAYILLYYRPISAKPP